MSYFSNLMDKISKVLVGYTTPKCIGIDISSSAVKMVELLPNKLVINKYLINPLPSTMVKEGVINDIENVAALIKHSWAEFKATYTEVAIAIPYNAVVEREINAPRFNYPYQLDEYIKLQLVKDLDNEDLDFDYILLNNQEQQQLIYVVVAKKEKIEEYQAIIQMSGIKVAAIDVEHFALQYLLEHILPSLDTTQQVLVIEVAATHIRGFVFIANVFILFNELIVDYNNLWETIVAEYGNPNDLQQAVNISAYASQLLIGRNLIVNNLLHAIRSDVTKILQQLKSNALVEKQLVLAADLQCYLFGGNLLLPGVMTEIRRLFSVPPKYATELIRENNSHVAEADLMRLFTSIALASWGHKIDQN